ncbi:helix-turn-helix transcriptional regulator [Brevibacillus daliensis]|uniref:helix-turn-helix transcriptional regulator n=1 Tax=Brevibacillus daliensis TaxID=2892995 RepID=UPI001E3B4CCB|nr:YafY family protein [Brevibacillus daliensis]
MNERRIAIMQIIDSRKKFTARELAIRFQVSIRTIQRDLDYLQQIGFPLYTEVGAHGGYRALPNRILPPLQLTQHEALGLFLMIQSLEKVTDFPFATIRSHLADQYYATLPTDVQDSIDRMKKHIMFTNHKSFVPSPYTTRILEAAIEKRAILFSYNSASSHKISQAFPLGIYFENGFWYMPARKNHRVLLYRVDRIIELAILGEVDESLPTLADWMLARDDRETTEVILQFTSIGARLAQSDRHFQPLQNNQWHGRIPPEEFSFTARKLLGYGPEVKIISPPQLQEMLVEMLEKNIKQYE